MKFRFSFILFVLITLIFFANFGFALTSNDATERSATMNDILAYTTFSTHDINATSITLISADLKRNAALANNILIKYVYTFTDDTTEDSNELTLPYPGTSYATYYFSSPSSTKQVKKVELKMKASGASPDIAYEKNSNITYSFEPSSSSQARITFNIFRKGTSANLTGVNLDSNIAAWDFLNQTSPQTTTYVDTNTNFDANFTRTGYDFNYFTGIADSNKTINVYLTDSTAPSVGITTLSGFTTWTNYIKGNGKIVGGTATDSGSDINQSSCEIQYFNAGAWWNESWSTNHCESTIFTAANGTTYQGNSRVKDNAGNTGTGTQSAAFIGDSNAPSTTFGSNQVSNMIDANLNFYCDDNNLSGCNYLFYKINNASTWSSKKYLSYLDDDSDLIAYYNFDENLGTTILDLNGGDHNGTIAGTVTIQPSGKIGSSWSSASAGKANVTNLTDLNFAWNQPFSICSWIKYTTSDILEIFGVENTAVGWYVGQTTGKLSIIISSVWPTNSYIESTTSTYNDGAWKFYCAVYDGNVDSRIYVNGAEVATTIDANTLSANPSYSGKTPTIGGRYADTYGRWDGNIDELSIWNKALSSNQISDLYNSGSGLAYPFTGVDVNYINFTYSGAGDHNIQYFSSDNIDNNEAIKTSFFTTNGFLHLKSWDENSGAALAININFNGVDYNNVSSQDINLSGLASGEYTITFSKTGYGTRYYTTSLTQFSDLNINMLMLLATQGIYMPYTVLKPDELTEYANVKINIYKPSKNNYTIGTYLTDAFGNMTVFTSILDQNYLFDINDGEELYTPVALTIKFPLDEETSLAIPTNYKINITGAGSQTFSSEASDKVVYLLSNTVPYYKIKIQDVNENYFPRSYYRNYKGNPGTDTLQPYLINILTGLLTTLRSVSGTTNQPIPTVNVKIYKDLPIGKTLVEDVITDAKGEALAYAVTGDLYYYEIYYNGLLVRTDTIIATSSVVYIRLDDLVYTAPTLGNLSALINFYPSYGSLSLADKKLIQILNINDSNSTTSITSVLIEVWNTDRNGVAGSSARVYSKSIAYTDQNSITNTIDINGLTRRIDANWYDTNGLLQIVVTIITTDGNYSTRYSYKPYTGFSPLYSIGFGSRTIFGCSSYYDSYGNPNPLIPCPSQLLFALFVSFILTAGLSFGLRFTSPAGLGIIFALIMGVFTYITFVPIVLYGLLVSGLVVVIIVAKGRFN